MTIFVTHCFFRKNEPPHTLLDEDAVNLPMGRECRLDATGVNKTVRVACVADCTRKVARCGERQSHDIGGVFMYVSSRGTLVVYGCQPSVLTNCQGLYTVQLSVSKLIFGV